MALLGVRGRRVSTGFYVNTLDRPTRKKWELCDAWGVIKDTLCRYFEIKKERIDLRQLDFGILTSTGILDFSGLYPSDDEETA